MEKSNTIRYGDRVKIIEHNNKNLEGKTGVLLMVQTMRPAIKGQLIKEKVCKIRLDTGNIIECILSKIEKVK